MRRGSSYLVLVAMAVGCTDIIGKLSVASTSGSGGMGGAGNSTSSSGMGGATGTGQATGSSTGSGAATSTASAGGASSSVTSSSTTSTSTGGVSCTDPAQCPAPLCEKAICDNHVCGTQPTQVGTSCMAGGSKKCDGTGQCVDCLTAADCPGATASCMNGVYTAPTTCIGGTCKPGDTTDCTVTQQVCTPSGCAQCLSNADCGPNPPAGCSTNTCNANGVCKVSFASQGSPCAQAPASTCDGAGACNAAKYVFVTSQALSSNFGGTMQADMKCEVIATSANLGGKWISWTSDAMSPVAARFMPSTNPYLLLDGTMVVPTGMNLTMAVPLVHGIDLDELKGSQPGVPVWTGTGPNGLSSGPSCNDWTSSSALTGTVGKAGATDATWTAQANAAMCATTMAHLYCVEL